MDNPDRNPRTAASATATSGTPVPDASQAQSPDSPESPESPFTVTAPSRLHRLRGPLLTGGLAAGLALALHVRDPHSSGSWGMCPWLLLTGHYCPGCGSLRAVNDLTNGDFVGALSSNLLFVVMLPLLVFWWVRWTQRAWSGATPPPARSGGHAHVWIALAALVMLAFGVLRNLPAGSWLAP